MATQVPRAKRQPLGRDAMIYSVDGKMIAPCMLRNISTSGAQIALQRETALPPSFVLSLSDNGQVRRRCRVVWQMSIVLGVSFEPASKSG